jgi:hypothetical protein
MPLYNGKKNEKWKLIALLINNFFSKKVNRKINGPGRLLEEMRQIKKYTRPKQQNYRQGPAFNQIQI